MISLSGMDARKLNHTTPHKIISYKGLVLLYKKSNIDVWNSNGNINIGNFDHVVVKQNTGKYDI